MNRSHRGSKFIVGVRMWKRSAGQIGRLLALSVALAAVAMATAPVHPALAASFVVNSTGSEPDMSLTDGVCLTSAGTCTLEAAIEQANYTPGPDDISFAPSITTIQLRDSLTPLLGSSGPPYAGGITIRGEGKITLDGVNLGPHSSGVPGPLPIGLDIRVSPSNKIQGLTLVNFGTGVLIEVADGNVVGVDGDGSGDASEGNVFQTNDIGVEIDRGSANRVSGNTITSSSLAGVRLDLANGNIIGINGDRIADNLERPEGNVISGNAGDGVFIDRGSQNRIAGNYIGVNASGSTLLGNSGSGIRVVNGSGNTIGTNGDGMADAAERNVISGNSADGILIDSATNNRIAGNYIGVNASGSTLLGNGGSGIRVANSIYYLGPINNTIGTNGDGKADAAERNVISGNHYDGILIDSANNSRIAGNYIGVDASGSIRLDNGGNGVNLVNLPSGSQNIIGTNGDGMFDPAEGNVISGNHADGILIDNGYGVRIGGNYIGVDANGSAAIPNVANGIELVNGSTHNVVGINSNINGNSGIPGGRNVISGNGGSGIRLVGVDGNFIGGNYIGTNAAGTAALGNHGGGIRLESGSDRNLIGTNASPLVPFTPAERNVISGNYSHGVYIEASNLNFISGNYVGTATDGKTSLPNQGNGVWVHTSATNVIGVPDESQGGVPDPQNGNVIAYNGGDGVRVDTAGFVGPGIGTSILDNTIYSNGSLGIDLAAFTDPPSGVTLNDPGDTDSGPNELMNFPRLILISNSGSSVSIYGGIFNGLPGQEFRIQFFANDTCDPSGYGEGRILLGETTVTTISSLFAQSHSGYQPGRAIFNVTFAKAIPAGDVFTSTATLIAHTGGFAFGSTSEFSKCTPAVGPIVHLAPVKSFGPLGPTNNPNPAFSWSAVEGATRYNLVVKGSAGTVADTWFEVGNNIETSICRKIGECTVQLDTPLLEGKYEWRVRAANDAGVGPFGQVISFTVDLTPPLAPAPASPPDGSTVSIKKLRLTWDKVADADLYHLQMAADPDFVNVAVDLTTPKTEFSPDVNQKLLGVYYWRVQARDAAGNWGAWSVLHTVTVVLSNPAEPSGSPTPTPAVLPTQGDNPPPNAATPTPTDTPLPTIPVGPPESTNTPTPGETPTAPPTP